MTDADTPSVLLVDDEPEVIELYEHYLEDGYEVLTATTGEAALAALAERPEVVVLDRRLPDMPGEAVLERIRERDLDCRVVMVTGVEPDFEIIEMPFDDYLVKPVGQRRLREAIDNLLARLRYSDLLREYYRVASKIAALEAAKPRWELEESEEFAALTERGERLREQVTETLMELDDYASAFYEAERAAVEGGDTLAGP